MKSPCFIIIILIVSLFLSFEGIGQQLNHSSIENGFLFQYKNSTRHSKPFLQSFEYWDETGSWDEIGPLTSSGNSTADIGRLSCICIDPENDSIILVGSPSGGLYYTLNKGDSWINAGLDRPKEQHNLDMFTPGIASIVIIHENGKTYWIIATGDKDHHFSYSRGVIISTDAGQNWSLINGIAPDNLSDNWYYIRKLISHPLNKNIMFAATSNGLFKSENILESKPENVKWHLILEDQPSTNEGFFDLEFHPSNPDTMIISREYRALNTISGNEIMWSTNGGDDWVPFPDCSTILPIDKPFTFFLSLLEPCPSNPDVMYVYLKGKGQSEDIGYYHSHWKYVFSENNWVQLNPIPFVSGNGRNGYAVSPIDDELLFCATVPTYLSTDGGFTWEKENDSILNNGRPKYYPHIDIQEFKFNKTGTEIWAATDGGPYMKTIGDTLWQNKVNNIGIAKILRFDQSKIDPDFYLFGGWDVGSQLYEKRKDLWTQKGVGDGFGCVFDNKERGTFYLANYNYTHNEIVRYKYYDDSTRTLKGNFWTANMAVCPTDNNTVYLSLGDQIQRSSNQGDSWTTLVSHENLGLEPENYLFYDMYVSEYNGNYLYLRIVPINQGQNAFIFKTKNVHSKRSSIVWEDITPMPYSKSWLSDLEIDAINPDRIWISYSTTEAQKVLEYDGKNWIDISGNLQEINSRVHSIAHLQGTNGALFAGTEYGIFYRENKTKNWILYKPGLPHTIPVDIIINYSTNKILTGLNGRGLWETALPKGYTAPNKFKEDGNTIMVYPNPVSGNFEIWSENMERGYDENVENIIQIYNAQGSLINEAKLIGNRKYITFNSEGWKRGIYFIVVSSNGEVVEQAKIIVK